MLIEKETSYTMGKVEANNEIIRMRRLVRQARVCVIHKLTREVKTLRTKKGTEKQQEKNKRKADKLLSEIHALKKIKVDCITKFGIANKRSLQEILQTKNVKENIRIMARIVDYKSLKNAIIKFREMYPDYEQYLEPKKKKSAKQKIKSEEKQSNNMEIEKETQLADEPTSDRYKDQSNDDDDSVNSKHSDIENELEQQNSEPGSMLRIKPPACVQVENNKNVRLKRDRKKNIEIMKERDDVYNNEDSKNVEKARETFEEDKEQRKIKVISKQATVKRFTELLQEQSTVEDGTLKKKDEKDSGENKSEPGKQIDSFFVCGDGDAYLSVAQPIIEESKDLLDDDNKNYNNKSRGYTNKRAFTNDKFFSNVKSIDTVRRKGKQKESWQNDKGSIENRNSFRKQKNVNTSSFNDVSKKRSIDARANSNENEYLHPSWIAKKKQQEIVKQGFQGKKIVFDDD